MPQYNEDALRQWLDDESRFQDWARKLPWYSEFIQEHGEEPDLNTLDYDYRRAWRQGIAPEKYIDGKYHWPSIDKEGAPLKSPSHKTWWKEEYMQKTGENPDELGITEPPSWLYDNTLLSPSGGGTLGENMLGNLGKALKGVGVARDLADPGVKPMMDDPSAFNASMLGFGLVAGPFRGALKGPARRLFSQVDDQLKNVKNTFKWKRGEELIPGTNQKNPNYFIMGTDEIDPDLARKIERGVAKGDQAAYTAAQAVRSGNAAFVKIEVVGDTWRVRGSGVYPYLQGSELGTQSYMKALSDAVNQGATMFGSDADVSVAAMRTWRSLARRGFNVEVNPTAVYDKRWGKYVMPEGDNPIFRIKLDAPLSGNRKQALKRFDASLEAIERTHKEAINVMHNYSRSSP